MQNFRNLAEKLATWGERLSVLIVLALVGINCADVLGAKLFDMPVKGATELVSMMQLVIIACVIGSTQMNRGHVSVEMFVTNMPGKAKSVIEIFISLLVLSLFSILAWQASRLGTAYYESGEVTATLMIPFYPFAFFLTLAMIPCIIMSVCDVVDNIKELI
jgi:TRAP-type mannitol/chloroaromatic compound transport system permease small subunit